MKIRLSELRQIIRETIVNEMGAPVAKSLDDDSMRVLSKIARSRPLPQTALRPNELDIAKTLQSMGFIAYDLGSKGYTTTDKGLDELGRW